MIDMSFIIERVLRLVIFGYFCGLEYVTGVRYHLSLFLCPHPANPALQLVYIVFWGSAVMLTAAYLYNHGEEFVNQPKLVKSD